MQTKVSQADSHNIRYPLYWESVFREDLFLYNCLQINEESDTGAKKINIVDILKPIGDVRGGGGAGEADGPAEQDLLEVSGAAEAVGPAGQDLQEVPRRRSARVRIRISLFWCFWQKVHRGPISYSDTY